MTLFFFFFFFPPLSANDSWSTKMVEVVHTVKSILQTTSADDCRPEKVLLFSTWPKLLRTVSLALAESDIISVMVQQVSSNGNFARNIEAFKHSDDVNVLLLPTTFAANGLNLTEANHVIFINSSLNRAEEQQAVGRVYRMGQQKYVAIFVSLLLFCSHFFNRRLLLLSQANTRLQVHHQVEH